MPALKPRFFLNDLLLIASLVGVAYLFDATHLSAMLDKTWIDSEVRGKGMTGEVLFLWMALLATAVGMPRQAIGFVAGYAFGVVPGTLFGVAATTGGCLITFFYARWFGRSLVEKRFSERIHRINDFIRDNTLSMTVLIRLLPVGNNLVTNLAAGVTKVRAAPFVLGSAIGYIPQTLVFALIGSGMSIDPLLRISLGAALFLVSGVLGLCLFRKFRRSRLLDPRLERDLGLDD